VKDYTSAILLAPEFAELYYNRGYANYKIKSFSSAIDDWNTAIKINPEYAAELNPKIKSLQGNK
jgi:tetratricopeptide (TPR) repeat protein